MVVYCIHKIFMSDPLIGETFRAPLLLKLRLLVHQPQRPLKPDTNCSICAAPRRGLNQLRPEKRRPDQTALHAYNPGNLDHSMYWMLQILEYSVILQDHHKVKSVDSLIWG